MTLRDDTESENSAALQEVSHYALRPRPEVILIGEVVHSNNPLSEEQGCNVYLSRLYTMSLIGC